MNEETKQFLIKVIIVAVVVYGFYMFTSPYQKCMRGEAESPSEATAIRRYCENRTAW